MSETAPVTTARYKPGPWVGMAAAGMWLVADLDPRDPVVEACWALVTEAAEVEQVLKSLAEAQLRPALNLAIVRLEAGQAEILVRGKALAEIVEDFATDAAPVEIRAGQGSFQDAKVDRFETIRLRLPADAVAVPALALGAGVVLVSQIAILASRPPVVAEEVAEEEPAGSQFDVLFGKTVLPEEQQTLTAAVPEEWMAGMRTGVQAPTGSAVVEPQRGTAVVEPQRTVPVVEPQRGTAVVEPQRAVPVVGPQRAVPTAEPQRATAVPPRVAAEAQRAAAVVGPRRAPAEPQGTVSVPQTGGDPFGDVSWAAVPEERDTGPDPYEEYHAAHPAPSSYLPPIEFSGGGGIDPELLRTVQRPPSAPVMSGPVVDAVRCDSGHLNPPSGGRCRICGGGIAPQTPQSVSRPKLGSLRLSTKEVVPLDRGVILGRAPGAPEGFGREEPYRIQLPSPDGGMSRRHVEVVLDGWTVTVVDLKSTNGTQVIPPGGTPETLPSGGRRVIDHGWTVSLDATTYFRFEVTE